MQSSSGVSNAKYVLVKIPSIRDSWTLLANFKIENKYGDIPVDEIMYVEMKTVFRLGMLSKNPRAHDTCNIGA